MAICAKETLLVAVLNKVTTMVDADVQSGASRASSRPAGPRGNNFINNNGNIATVSHLEMRGRN